MPPSADSAGRTPGVWGCRALRTDGSTSSYFLVQSAQHADRDRIILPESQALTEIGNAAICAAHCDEGDQVRSIVAMSQMAPTAPAMWFAELAEPDARTPAFNLMAFEGHDVEAGRLLDPAALRQTTVTSADQLGALRLYPETGEFDQVYVSPKWRRRGVGSVLILAAATLAAARGWGDAWSDGQRTADGERLMKARPEWAHRVAELTHLAAPMTPFEER